MALTEYQREAIKLKATQTSQIGVAGMAVIGFGAVAQLSTGPITEKAILRAFAMAIIAFVFALVMRQIAVWRLKDLNRD